MSLQLYLHIPFCKRKCLYCDFSSFTATAGEMEAYVAALEKEIAYVAGRWQGVPVRTLFIGGGTPSLLPMPLFRRLMQALVEGFALEGLALGQVECTMEANPGTLTEDWLVAAAALGVNRLSLGVQAMQPQLLQALGRIHTFDQAREAVKMARMAGIHNINMDVMLGLPGQSQQDYLATLGAVCALEPTHLSSYALIVEEGTPLHRSVEAGKVSLPAEDETASMMEAGMDWLAGHGYAQYEISNFAKPGYMCRHNLGYWQGAWYVGMGLAAHSLVPVDRMPGGEKVMPEASAYVRYANHESLADYIRLLEEGDIPLSQVEWVSPEEAMFETMMLGLRTTAGVGAGAFALRHGKGLEEVYGPALVRLERAGLAAWRVEAEERRFALTRRGLLLQNQVMLWLMPE